MKAMIMAAGVGSRLMPLTNDIPKPMVPMANRPLMENSIRLLQEHGCVDIIANLHHKGDIIRDYFQEGSQFGVNMNYSPEKELLGTAGGVKKCAWFLDDTFIILSGDALTDINISLLYEKHKKSGALASIALKKVEQVEQFGVVICDKQDRIVQFQEKPQKQEALSNLANTGIYIFEKEIFNYIPAQQFFDFGKQLFPYLAKIKAPFYGFPIEEYWCDIGNINIYRQAHKDILQGAVNYKINGKLLTRQNGSHILLGHGVEIGENVNINGFAVFGNDCKIRDGASIKDSVIWEKTIIGQYAQITDSVISSNCNVEPNAKIEDTTVV